jgi:hypothetical protein
MSLLSDLQRVIGDAKAGGYNAVGIVALELLVVKHLPKPPLPLNLFIRFGCGHEQKIGPNDDIASFVENARFEPCDACALARAAS